VKRALALGILAVSVILGGSAFAQQVGPAPGAPRVQFVGQPGAPGNIVVEPVPGVGAGDVADAPPEQPAPTQKGSALAFWIFAALAVGGAIATITRRNPVTAVMFLVGTFFAIAAVYAMLFAHFMAAIQVLVYAGAIMVLFVFVIMILNKEEEEPWALRGWFGKTLAAAALTWFLARIVQVLWSINQSPVVTEKLWKAGEFARYGSTKTVGKELFTSYLFPFEAISIALLIAIVGAVVLAHPEHATEGGGHARGPAGHGPGEA
jgi:NADH-quinone oxidoreductase subunit J